MLTKIRFRYVTWKHVLSHVDCIITGAIPDEQERSKCTSHKVESPRDPSEWTLKPTGEVAVNREVFLTIEAEDG